MLIIASSKNERQEQMSQNKGKTGGVLLRAVMMCVIGCISIAGAMAETYVLDMYQKADDPAGRKFRTAKAAIEALRDGTKSEPTILIVKPGVYWLDDPDDPEVRRPKEGDNGIPYAATLKASNLVIRGEEGAADRTIFAVNRGQTQGAVGNYTMLKVTGSDIRVENVTFGNYCNVDLVYKSNPSLTRGKRKEAIVQAQIAICHGSDRLHFRNCNFVSRLNLCPFVGARRTLYENCHFGSTDDALTGTGLYVGCHFTFYSGKPFYSTSRTGAVMLGCKIDSKVSGTQYLTKVGGPVTMVDCEIEGQEVKEMAWSKGDEPYVCYVSNVRLNGREMKIDEAREWRTVRLEGEALRAYKNADGTYNIAGLCAGDDGWNPTGKAGRSRAVTLTATPNTVTAKPMGDRVQMVVSAYRWGMSEPDSTWSDEYVSNNTTWHEMVERRTIRSREGLQAVAAIKVEGQKVEAPKFVVEPTIERDRRSNEMRVRYRLQTSDETDMIGNNDYSLVTWMRVESNGDTTALKESRDAWTKTVYNPTAADKRRKIVCRVVPQLVASEAGAEVTLEKRCRLADDRTEVITTDFSDVPVRHSDRIDRRGVWQMDAHKPADTKEYDWKAQSSRQNPAWRYGTGIDGVVGRGLITERRGARLTYNMAKDRCQRMTVRLTIDPSKTAGQGFGSATGQYLDIKVKYDAETGKGVGIRIERTPDYDRSVTVTAIEYDGENVKRLTEAVECKTFKTGCNILIDSDGEQLRAVVGRGEEPQVTLRAKTSEIRTTGLQIQHTGSTGASALMLHTAEIEID